MRGSNKKNLVMIADDDMFVRKVVSAALHGLCDIVEVTDGAQVVDTYLARNPDMLFLDIHLPNVLGMDLIHNLLHKDKGAFIVMLSADSSEQNVRNSRLRGAKGFVTKPFTKDRILHYFNKCPTIQFIDVG